MRILHLNSAASYVGGAENYIAEVAAALRDAGHESNIVYFEAGDARKVVADATHVPLPEWPANPAEAVYILEKAVGQFRPDVAFAHSVYHPTLLKWVAKNLPTVGYVHGPFPVCPGSGQYLRRRAVVCPHRAGPICLINAQLENCCWGRNPLRHWRLLRRVRAFVEAYQEVDEILVGSQYMLRLLERGNIPSGKTSILPPVLIQEPLPDRVFDPESRKILFAGRLVPEKGLQYLIRALARVNGAWQLVVAGEGQDRDCCEKLAAGLGVSDRIQFLGWLDSSEMTMCLQECAFVAVPSLWPEPFGRLGPEACMHSRPVVAFAVGGIPDWLDHGRTGLLVPPGDIAGLVSAIQSLLDSPPMRRQMGQEANQKAKTQWLAADHIGQVLGALERAQKHWAVNNHRPSISNMARELA
jgi:glycosyltransferase involved in cell wall biosynthesis